MNPIVIILILFALYKCSGENSSSHASSTCEELRKMEAFQMASRNTINKMNEEHSSDAMQSALNDADDALDILQAKLEKECSQ